MVEKAINTEAQAHPTHAQGRAVQNLLAGGRNIYPCGKCSFETGY